jgi:exopolyphosphatase/guanosine-5'-triphosphate,3'-diphosphate pyrophosphatase
MPVFAAVDIGSNSVRLKISRLQGSKLIDLHEDRAVTRLGELAFRTGYLAPDAMADTVKILRRFHKAAQKLGADRVRAVGTSAMRDARNSQAFLEWVRSATGWNLEIISGQEEGRLIHLGLVSNLRLPATPVLMMDLGGGSCELTISKQGHIKETTSLPLGAVRLTNEFLRHDPPRSGELERMRGFITRYVGRVAAQISRAGIKATIATSGTAAALAALSEATAKPPGSSKKGLVTQHSARRLVKILAQQSVDERKKLAGIGPRRAEIIIAGASVYAEILERCRLSGFRYSPLGLRDGLLAQMAAEYDIHTRSGKQIESERWDSVMAAVQHYRVEEDHALGVREFALQLFDVLKSCHLLPPEYRELLGASAMLYEVGDYINRNGRHRHTHYILANSEMAGYTPEQRMVIATIARYMGKTQPLPADVLMKSLLLSEQERVRKAVCLLRLARALNLGRSDSVRSVRIYARGADVKLTLVPKRGMGADLELWAIEKEQLYFRELFGRTLSATVA